MVQQEDTAKSAEGPNCPSHQGLPDPRGEPAPGATAAKATDTGKGALVQVPAAAHREARYEPAPGGGRLQEPDNPAQPRGRLNCTAELHPPTHSPAVVSHFWYLCKGIPGPDYKTGNSYSGLLLLNLSLLDFIYYYIVLLY